MSETAPLPAAALSAPTGRQALRRPPQALAPADARVPERFDLWLAQLYGTARARWPGDARALRRFAERTAADMAGLQTEPDATLQARLPALRAALAREGLDGSTLPKALALVAVMAARSLGLQPYAGQLMGAGALLAGRMAEMATGEGKSLVAALAAATAALAGRAVHVVTVNDYLAERDAERHRPLFEALGLQVACTRAGQTPPQRRAAYRADVTYCTNKDVVFDHLRDRIASGTDRSLRRRLVQRALDGAAAAAPLVPALQFAIVDEADSVLIDEARTPLIISRDGDRSHLPVYREAIAFAQALLPERDWHIDGPDRQVALTEAGRDALGDLTAEAGPVWNSERMREFLAVQALSALHLYRLDRDYIVRDGKVQIVDEYTGRVLSDRSWERGLHQMVEAKEGLDVSPARESIARITYQRFFLRYERLAGMTGTAREVAGELWAVYGLRFVPVPTRLPVCRRDLGTRLFGDDAARGAALVERCRTITQAGRSVLIGTRSVQGSERVAGWLAAAGLAHVVLNARQDADEAAIVARAGEPGRITVATNMAGRGTDILLDPAVRDAGGLHVVLTEFHESGRIDRQLVGRAARQGDPGSFEALVTVGDDLFHRHGGALGRSLAARPGHAEWPAPVAALLRRRAQRRAEALHARVRMQTLRQDVRRQQLMGFAGKGE